MNQAAQQSQSILLSAADVDRLLKDDSPDSRVSVLEKVSDQYNANTLGDRERFIAEHIFRLLMKDAAVKVRRTLSERIKENTEIPRDIVLHVAQDVADVSVPLLEVTQVLSDADLVEIVEATRDLSKLVAISKRETVSERVSDALVGTHYPQVVSGLLGNEGASISDKGFDIILDEFKGDKQVMDALVERGNLPLTVVEHIVSRVSDTVARQLKRKYKLSDAQIEKDTAGTRDDVMVKMLRHDLSEQEVLMLVGQMAQQNRLTPSFVMTALCRGQLNFFTAAMAHFAHISLDNARRLIGDKGELGFKGIYAKSGLPPSMFNAVRLILQQVKEISDSDAVPGSLLYANRLVERLLAAASGKDIDNLPYFIALIRQNVHRH